MEKLPDFVVGGAQKCGTTSLHYYLAQHSDIFVPMKQQETHFFDFDENYRKGTEWYLRCFEGRKNESIVGQTSPLYIYLEKVPSRIHKFIPEVKLIFLLRNPVDRAYSHYWHEWKKGRESLGFEEAIEKEDSRIKVDFWHKRHFSYLSRGLYIEQIYRYLRYFSRSQMLLILYDDFSNDPIGTLKKCFGFLGVDENAKIDVRRKYNQTVTGRYRYVRKLIINRLTGKSPFVQFLTRLDQYYVKSTAGYPEMNSETRENLREYFRPFNEKLEAFLEIGPIWNR